MTVLENLEMGAAAWRRRGAALAEDIAAVFRLFPRLHERRKQLAWSLSGGEQQMLAVGRALMGRPKLLLLDEPLSNLDAKLRERMRFELRELQRQLRGDLDTIVLKALKKRPEERYGTAAEMAEDLRRHSAGEAVLARLATSERGTTTTA